jgi:hypothetical protein
MVLLHVYGNFFCASVYSMYPFKDKNQIDQNGNVQLNTYIIPVCIRLEGFCMEKFPMQKLAS